MGLTRTEFEEFSKIGAGDSFTLPNGKNYNMVDLPQKKGFWKNGSPISEEEYRAASQAFFDAIPAQPSGPLVFPTPADASPEAVAAAFNEWGKANILKDIFGDTPGFFTEEAVEPAKAFMAKTNFVAMPVADAKPLIAKSMGYENPHHLGLEHQVQAAWKTLDGRIIFYCDLQGGMFLTTPPAA